MGFQLSPGVVTSEIDLTTVVPAVATSTGAFAGVFQWGPVEQAVQITDEVRLVSMFGKPDINTAMSFFTCSNFLSYGNDLRVVRAANSNTTFTATSGNDNSPIGGLTDGGTYYVRDITPNSFKISTLLGGAEIDLTTTGNKYQYFIFSGDSYQVSTANVSTTSNTITITNHGLEAGEEVVYKSAGNYIIKNDEHYYNNYHLTPSPAVGEFAARYPGAMGNSLRVEVCSNSGDFANWDYRNLFNSAPGTSAFAAKYLKDCYDEMHIVVVDQGGLISGTKETVLEVFPYASKAIDAKDDTGNSNYFREVIYRKSKYIYCTAINESAANNDGASKQWGYKLSELSTGDTFIQLTTYSEELSGGVDGTPGNGDIITAYDKFANAEEIDISLVMTGAHSTIVARHVIDDIVESRKDCVAFVSPPLAATQNPTGPADAIAGYRNGTSPYSGTDGLARSTSYAVMDSAWKYQYDKYNDMYRWVPANGDMAGLCVRTDATRDPWFSPAGLSRGNIKNVVKLSFNPNKSERDTLYKNGINPIVAFPGEGILLFGDKTLLAKPSAFDRINVRRLFIVLEKAIARAARSSLFEFNDEFTRAQFVSLVEPFLRDVQSRRGIYDFRVVCDTTNNTGEVIDRNEFRGDIYIKPARSINFIQLNFVAVRTGVSFDEVVGKF